MTNKLTKMETKYLSLLDQDDSYGVDVLSKLGYSPNKGKLYTKLTFIDKNNSLFTNSSWELRMKVLESI